MTINILVVEDKVSLNRSIVNMLQKEGYTAVGAVDIDEAKDKYVQEKPHIVLLDIMLPQGKGYELIPFFRNHFDSRILMLTALDDEQSKRICYENGTDDYITKPFDMYELLYKLNAIRRRILSNLKQYQIGDIRFNIETNQITCKQKTMVIQPSQVKFLKLLYEKYMENSYISKTEIGEGFSDEVDESPRIQTLVARLRKNLQYIGSEQVEIETIYGNGYRMILHVKKEK